MLKRKLIALILIVSILTPFFYLPYQAKKAEAFLGFGDISIDIKQLIEKIADTIAMAIAQRIIDDMVQSTVKWAQSGFEGNPSYVTDQKQFFTDIADGVAGQYIQGSDLGFLCSPFQANIKLSLTQQYYQSQPFQCTLTDVVGNIENFYNDFNQGGWEAWFSMTQNPTNNPYDAYLKAKLELDSRIAKAVGVEKEQLDWNQGFLSWSSCEETNPSPTIQVPDTNMPGVLVTRPNPSHNPSKAIGECIKRGPTQTPGSTIKSQLDKVLPSGLEKLISAEHFDQLVSAFASGLLTRYVFGPKGIFARGSNVGTAEATNSSSKTGNLDVDSDNIPDGQDFDRDQKLESKSDICYHGERFVDAPNTTQNSTQTVAQVRICINSGNLTTSPYFTPVCRAVTEAVRQGDAYKKFMNAHKDMLSSETNFRADADASLWGNRLTDLDSSLSTLVSIIQGRNSAYLDTLEITANRYSVYISETLESLTGDGFDLDLAVSGSGGGGLSNLEETINAHTVYLTQINQSFGDCTNPNIANLGAIGTPIGVGINALNPNDSSCSASQALPMPSGSPPDGSATVRDIANQYPELLKSSGQNMDFLDKVVAALHAQDSNWGYNGKRGNAGDLSQDAIAYLADAPDKVHVIDIISGHGGSNPQPAWQNVTRETYGCGTIGRYVYPR